MTFRPNVGDRILIGGEEYTIAEHPSAPGIPYGQEGRQAIVYQLVAGEDKQAIKVFKPRFQVPAIVSISRKLAQFAEMPGLRVCTRTVLTVRHEAQLLNKHPELLYGVLMPWIEGPTWMEVLVKGDELTAEQSLQMARALADTLSEMEQEGLAHCDLSGPNVIVPMLARGATGGDGEEDRQQSYPIELVDVEQMFGVDMKRPELLPGGSSGYAHETAPKGLWQPDADRFAGAVLLAEMLGWCDERVREAAWGENYFDPGEMQQQCERYETLLEVLDERWGEGIARLFAWAWESVTLDQCPTFGPWQLALSEGSLAEKPKRAKSGSDETGRGSNDALASMNVGSAEAQKDPSMPVREGEHTGITVGVEDSTQGKTGAKNGAEIALQTLLRLGRDLEEDGNLKGAFQCYQEALSLAPEGSAIANELVSIIQALRDKLQEQESQSAGSASSKAERVADGSMKADLSEHTAQDTLILSGIDRTNGEQIGRKQTAGLLAEEIAVGDRPHRLKSASVEEVEPEGVEAEPAAARPMSRRAVGTGAVAVLLLLLLAVLFVIGGQLTAASSASNPTPEISVTATTEGTGKGQIDRAATATQAAASNIREDATRTALAAVATRSATLTATTTSTAPATATSTQTSVPPTNTAAASTAPVPQVQPTKPPVATPTPTKKLAVATTTRAKPTNTSVRPTNTVTKVATPTRARATNTRVPPTSTRIPITNTPVPPTHTPVPPTHTQQPPTNTPVPTEAPVPATNTPRPPPEPTDTPTNTPRPPTDTPTNTPRPPTDTPTKTPTDTPTKTPTDTPGIPPTNTPRIPPTNTPRG